MPYGTRSRRLGRRTVGLRRRTFRRRAPRATQVPRPVMRKRSWTRPHLFKRVASSSELNAQSLIATAVSGTGVITLTGPYLRWDTDNNSGATYASFGCAFNLAASPGAGELSVLYDKYKILGIAFRLYPVYQQGLPTETTGAGGYFGGMVHSVVDYDDNAAFAASETGLKLMREHQGYRMSNMHRRGAALKRYFRPRPRGQVDSNAGTGKIQLKGPWVDMQDNDVPYFGIKWMFEGWNSDAAVANHVWKLEAVYYITCAGVR